MHFVGLLAVPGLAVAQRAVATAAVNVRSGQSTSSRIITHLNTGDTVALLSPTKRSGYYHISEDDTTGWVYGRYLRLLGDSTAPVTATPTVPTTHVGASAPGTPGSAALQGCGDHLWQHVYHPQRLLVKQACVTVRGTIVDATARCAAILHRDLNHSGLY
jgi:uncharacterized protein YraI